MPTNNLRQRDFLSKGPDDLPEGTAAMMLRKLPVQESVVRQAARRPVSLDRPPRTHPQLSQPKRKVPGGQPRLGRQPRMAQHQTCLPIRTTAVTARRPLTSPFAPWCTPSPSMCFPSRSNGVSSRIKRVAPRWRRARLPIAFCRALSTVSSRQGLSCAKWCKVSTAPFANRVAISRMERNRTSNTRPRT